MSEQFDPDTVLLGKGLLEGWGRGFSVSTREIAQHRRS